MFSNKENIKSSLTHLDFHFPLLFQFMTHPGRDVDSGDVILSWITHRFLPQEHKAFRVICGDHFAICHHAYVVLVPVLPVQTREKNVI